jgi:quinol monooxygenase YgiN
MAGIQTLKWTDDRFVVLATFKVGPENKSAFLEAAKDDALQSLASESGCLQFDVVCLEGDKVLFYEAYSDKAAFDHHLEIAHFRRFQAAMLQMDIAEPQVRFGQRMDFTAGNSRA